MGYVLSAVGATVGLWQEVGGVAIVFFFHFLGGFSRENCKYIHIPTHCPEMKAPASRKDRESLGP